MSYIDWNAVLLSLHKTLESQHQVNPLRCRTSRQLEVYLLPWQIASKWCCKIKHPLQHKNDEADLWLKLSSPHILLWNMLPLTLCIRLKHLSKLKSNLRCLTHAVNFVLCRWHKVNQHIQTKLVRQISHPKWTLISTLTELFVLTQIRASIVLPSIYSLLLCKLDVCMICGVS